MADRRYVGWTESSIYRYSYSAWIKPQGRGTVRLRLRVNPPGTFGFLGAIDDGRVVYQEIRRDSDIRFFNIVSKRRYDAPRRVNTRAWEWGPAFSGSWLMFGRGQEPNGAWLTIMTNLKTGRLVVLDRVPHKYFTGPGQVSENYAVWYTCARRCEVYRYQMKTGRRMKIPNPQHYWYYAPSVDRNGTVYFMRSRDGCGKQASLMKYSPKEGFLELRRFQGEDSATTYVYRGRDGKNHILYDRIACRTKHSDINELVDSTS